MNSDEEICELPAAVEEVVAMGADPADCNKHVGNPTSTRLRSL